jgi:dCTP deaminase
MGILSDRDIRKAREKGELIISDFKEELLSPASYDLRVGNKALKSVREREKVIVDLSEERILEIDTAEFAEIITLERLELSKNLSGRIGIRSYFTRKGLIPFTGAQVDPGWKGNLIISLFNTGPRTIVLRYGEPFCTIEFNRLESEAEKGYSGEYQNQTDFPTENIEFILGAKGVTLYEVVETMKSLSKDVGWIKWLLALMFAALMVQWISSFVF